MKKVMVLGMGGAGASIGIQIAAALGAELILVNTDETALQKFREYHCLPIGSTICAGRAAHPVTTERKAAEASLSEVDTAIGRPDLLVIAAGLGGGTGTGATTVIAKRAKEHNIAVVIAATLPFTVERERRKNALQALKELGDVKVPTLIYDLGNAENRLADEPLLGLFDDAATSLVQSIRGHMSNEAQFS